MNKVIAPENVVFDIDNADPIDWKGSIWKGHGEEMFIFSQVDVNKYCLIGFTDGNRWLGPHGQFSEIVKGATLYKKEATITIK